MIIIPSLGLGYQPAPKIATTSMFDWLFACLGPEAVADLPTEGGKANAVRNYFIEGCGDIRRAANTPEGVAPYADYFRFTITRDPIRRFLSMYANRVVHHGELGPASDAAKALRAAGLPFNPGINLLVERMEEYFEVARSIRHHALPMVHFLGQDFSVYGRVLDIAQVPALLEEIRRYWAVNGRKPLASGLPPMPRRQTGGPKLAAQVLKEAAFEKLMAYYAEDYRFVPTLDAGRTREDYESARAAARASAPKPAPLPPARWALLAEVDKGALETGAAQGHIGGVVVLAARAPEGSTLRLWVDETELPLSWGLPSPHAA
ncbi:MAG: sulfotransferase family 2 domain-containing protein, partial [Gammaproteobacteria bacterium]